MTQSDQKSSPLCSLRTHKDQRLLHANNEDWSDWVDAQADLSLRSTRRPFCWLYRAPHQIRPFIPFAHISVCNSETLISDIHTSTQNGSVSKSSMSSAHYIVVVRAYMCVFVCLSCLDYLLTSVFVNIHETIESQKNINSYIYIFILLFDCLNVIFENIYHSSIFEPRHDKTNKVTVRPVKTQISLGIRSV